MKKPLALISALTLSLAGVLAAAVPAAAAGTSLENQAPSLEPTVRRGILSPGVISQVQKNGGYGFAAEITFSDDDSQSWTATAEYGDGTPAQSFAVTGSPFNLDHAYTDTTSHTITYSLTDNQGLTSTATTPSRVMTASVTPSQQIPLNSVQTLNYSFAIPAIPRVTGITAYFYDKDGNRLPIIQDATANPGTVTINNGQADYIGVYPGSTMTGTFTVSSADNKPVGLAIVDRFNSIIASQKVSFGPPPTYNLTGLVFNDINRNGVKDSFEGGLNNVTVTLNNGATAQTNSSGNYTFTALPSASYTVTANLPFLYVKTTANPATVNLDANKAQNFGARFSLFGL